MAFGDPYATVHELEIRLRKSDDSTFADLLDAASRAVEHFTGRQFNKDTSAVPVATARKFRAVDPQRLPVDDFYTTTGLAIMVDTTAWLVTDVDPRPWGGVYEGQPGWPYFDLLSIRKPWPADRRARITVTAFWGWTAVPEGIQQATLDVAEVMSFGGGSSGAVRSEAIDGYSVSYGAPQLGKGSSVPTEFAKAVPYRRFRAGIA